MNLKITYTETEVTAKIRIFSQNTPLYGEAHQLDDGTIVYARYTDYIYFHKDGSVTDDDGKVLSNIKWEVIK